MKKNTIMLQRFSFLIAILFLVHCSSIEHPIVEPTASISCDTILFFKKDDRNSYCFNKPEHACFRVFPMDKGFYPILELREITGNIVDSATQFGVFTEARNQAFLTQDEATEALRIQVDTLTELTFYDDSLKKSHCFQSRWISLENTSKKSLLLDRYQRIKYLLQAKDEKGKWHDLHDTWGVTCGLENNLHPERPVQTLPPECTAVSKLLLEDGDFLAECRVQYKSYNSLDSFYHRTGETTGYYYPRFNHFDSISPIYSNHFYQKVSKARFRKARVVF